MPEVGEDRWEIVFSGFNQTYRVESLRGAMFLLKAWQTVGCYYIRQTGLQVPWEKQDAWRQTNRWERRYLPPAKTVSGTPPE